MASNPLSRALAVANFLALGIGGFVGWPQITQALNVGTPSVNCVQVFEVSMGSEVAHPYVGSYWDCLAPIMQKAYFNNNGWNGDKDIQAWYNELAAQGFMFKLTPWSGGPTNSCVTDPITGSTTCDSQYLEFVGVYKYSPGSDTSMPEWVFDGQHSFSATIHINDQGKISNLL